MQINSGNLAISRELFYTVEYSTLINMYLPKAFLCKLARPLPASVCPVGGVLWVSLPPFLNITDFCQQLFMACNTAFPMAASQPVLSMFQVGVLYCGI